MALLTFRAPDIFNRNTIHLPCFKVLMEPFINAIELISVPFAVREIHFRGAVTVNAPAHAERGKLLNLIHFSDISMTGLALYLARPDMLGMVEIHMIGEIVDFYPFNLFSRLVIFSGCRIIPGITV